MPVLRLWILHTCESSTRKPNAVTKEVGYLHEGSYLRTSDKTRLLIGSTAVSINTRRLYFWTLFLTAVCGTCLTTCISPGWWRLSSSFTLIVLCLSSLTVTGHSRVRISIPSWPLISCFSSVRPNKWWESTLKRLRPLLSTSFVIGHPQ